MSTISLEEAQAHLPELIDRMSPGEQVCITRNQRTIAKLTVDVEPEPKPLRRLGTMKGTVLHTDPDFDVPLEEFKEYME